MILKCYDPGITTGCAMVENEKYYFGQIDSKDLLLIYDDISNSFSLTNPLVLGYEDFKHRPQIINTELYSLQVIGAIRLWATLHGQPEPFCYLPAKAKAFWSDDKIKAIHLWQPGKKHAMDALRVLLTYRMENDKEWFKSIMGELRDNIR